MVNMPQLVPVQPVPCNDQFSWALGLEPGAGVNVATNDALAPGITLEGALSCSVKLLVISIVAEPPREASATLAAMSVIVAGLGNICGAV